MATLTHMPELIEPSDTEHDPVLEVHDLHVHFKTHEGLIRAVNGVSFDVPRGSIVGIVGESGCGKSVTAYSILRLIQKPGLIAGGQMHFHPLHQPSFDICQLAEKSRELFDMRGGLASMIFQEPMTALSPVHTVGNQIVEAIRLHKSVTKKQARQMAIDMLAKVGIPGPERRIDQYTFELSGGMRCRVMIAMALVCQPQLLIADEPTTALDVTIQAQIMRLIKQLQEEMKTSTILITHDLGVVGQMCDHVVVMYMGRVVETGPVRRVIHHPRHPYTQGLLASLPSLAVEHEKLPSITGSVPSLTNLPSGCAFHPRCPHAQAGLCDVNGPPELESLNSQQAAACLRVHEIEDDQAQ